MLKAYRYFSAETVCWISYNFYLPWSDHSNFVVSGKALKLLIIVFFQSLSTITLSDSESSSVPCSRIFCSFFGVGDKVTRIFKRIRKSNDMYSYFKLYLLYGRQTHRRCTIFVTIWYGYKQGNKFNVYHHIPNFSSSTSTLPSLSSYFYHFCVCSLFKKLN